MTVRPLTDWFPVKVERVKKVLRDVKIQDDVKQPQDLPEQWIAEFDDIPDDDGADKVLKAVEDEISVLEESYGAPILDLLARAIKMTRSRGERALPVSVGTQPDLRSESKQHMIEVVSEEQSPSGDTPVAERLRGDTPVAEAVAEPVAELESLGFSLEPIIPDTMIDYDEVIVKKDGPFKDIKFANMTLNQIQAYKEMLSQVPDAESTWLQSFDDITARGYQDRQTANEIREAYMWDQGFGEPSATKSEDYGGYAEREYSIKIWLKYCDLARCNTLSMITIIGYMKAQRISSLSECLHYGWVILLMSENFSEQDRASKMKRLAYLKTLMR